MSHLKIDQSVFLVGEKKGGVERAAKQLQSFGQILKLDSARHCQLWHLKIEKTEKIKPLESWLKTYTVQVNEQELTICALPGVFSQTHLDVGTAVLLPYLNQVKSGRIADFGCGAGIISCYLAKANSSNIIHALDIDAIFIEFAGFGDGRGYSFAALLRRQGFQGELRATGDVFKDVLNYLKRSGFDSFVIKEGKDVQEAAAGLQDFTHPYQASTAVPKASYQTGA